MKDKNQKYTLVKTLMEFEDHIYNSLLFKSLNDIYYILFTKYKSSMIYVYDLNNKQIICIINESHSDNIQSIEHILDKKNKRDLIMIISVQKIKIWNFTNMQCLTEINKNNKDEYKVCYISYLNNNDIYIIESSSDMPIFVYNIEGNKIKEIKNDETIYAMKAFYDIKTSKSYLVLNSVSYLKSYDFDNDKEYVYYFHDTYNEVFDIVINSKQDETLLIGVGLNYPFIIIWNFHSGDKLYDIYLQSNINSVNDIMYIQFPFLWDEQHLCFIFQNDIGKGFPGVNSIKVLNLNNLNNCDNLIIDKNKRFFILGKIKHPIYGDCLITESQNEIGLWKEKENSNSI